MQPGWYPDPDDPAARRYWDGGSWSASLPFSDAVIPGPSAYSGPPPSPSSMPSGDVYDLTASYGPAAHPAFAPTAVYPPPPYTPSPGRRRPGRQTTTLLVVVGAVIVLAGGALGILFGTGVLDTTSTPAKFAVVGTLELVDDEGGIDVTGGQCEGADNYSDIYEGSHVDITDEGGTTLQLVELQSGAPGGDGTECNFVFQAEIEPGHAAYGVEVSNRGVVEFTEEEMRDGPEIVLGD